MSSAIPRFTEAHLCALWQRQLIDPARLMAAGVPVHVVFQGWRTYDRGPDFRDAIVQIGNGPLRHGNVEVHLRTSGWKSHRHDGDPAYNGLALHVVWEHDGTRTFSADGTEVPTVALNGCLTAPLAELLPRLHTLALPPHGSFVCPGGAVTSSVGAAATIPGLVTELGAARLGERAATIEAEMAVVGPEQTWWRAVLGALGYQRNRRAAERLAGITPYRAMAHLLRGQASAVASASTRAEGFLLGAAGLLPQQRPRAVALDESGTAYFRAATTSWAETSWACTDAPLFWSDWTTVGVRPANGPERRLAAAVRLALPMVRDGLHDTLSHWLLAAAAQRTLLQPVQAPDSYWASHSAAGRALSPAPQALVGRRRMADIAVNVTLPVAIALARRVGSAELERAAIECFNRLPASGDNQLSRLMFWQLTDRSGHVALAAQEQGLLHVYHRWCRDKRCWECPLARVVAPEAYPDPTDGQDGT